jgi:uncharacterized protein YunC (DUF1805 family)
MEEKKFSVGKTEAIGYVIPIGKVNLVFAKTPKGLIGCGALDVIALEKFELPAAKVRPVGSDSVKNIEDLLSGIVVVANRYAKDIGINIDMTGREALEHLNPDF